MIKKTAPSSTRIVISYPMKQVSWCAYDGKSMESEKTICSEFPNGEKAIVEKMLASGEINKSKRAWLRESESGIQVGMLTIWVRSFEIEKLLQSSPGLSVSPEFVSQSLWWTLKSPMANTLADGLIKRASSPLDEIESKTVDEDEEGDDR